ncbi:MAG: aldose 1-epimerase [Flavobacteriaceae bacterium]|nr:aldose 1-epimerase [Flavobacteriaceae bacterium]
MYSIDYTNINGDKYVELKSKLGYSYAKILINKGGGLQTLSLNKRIIIEELDNSSPEKKYASSIMFPFAGRINEGLYNYNDEEYDLSDVLDQDNEVKHGFLIDKNFDVKEENITDSSASVILVYVEDFYIKGFPFKYQVELTYLLSNYTLNLDVKIKNKSNVTFPFSIGWHPYFISKDSKGTVYFNSKNVVVFNEKMIPKEVAEVEKVPPINIREQHLDDCFELEDNLVQFKTSSYAINIKSTSSPNFLQLYTPVNNELVAIEVMTAPADSFNNKIGLQYLDSNETYTIGWEIKEVTDLN